MALLVHEAVVVGKGSVMDLVVDGAWQYMSDLPGYISAWPDEALREARRAEPERAAYRIYDCLARVHGADTCRSLVKEWLDRTDDKAILEFLVHRIHEELPEGRLNLFRLTCHRRLAVAQVAVGLLTQGDDSLRDQGAVDAVRAFADRRRAEGAGPDDLAPFEAWLRKSDKALWR